MNLVKGNNNRKPVGFKIFEDWMRSFQQAEQK